jgi:hypothetical protein
MVKAVANKAPDVFQLTKYDFSRDGSMLRNSVLAKIPKRAQVDVQISGQLGTLDRKMCFVRSVGGQLYLGDVITGSLYDLKDGWCATSEFLSIQITKELRAVIAGLKPENDTYFH